MRWDDNGKITSNCEYSNGNVVNEEIKNWNTIYLKKLKKNVTNIY
jgi:hypothetical protein